MRVVACGNCFVAINALLCVTRRQAMVSGPVVWDLIYHFYQCWPYSESRRARKAMRLRIKSTYTSRGSWAVCRLSR